MFEKKYAYDDILIVQNGSYNDIKSRKNINIYKNGRFPLISASMSVFDNTEFATALAEEKCLHIFSRHEGMPLEKRIAFAKESKCGFAVSLEEFKEKKDYLQKLNVIISLDIANGNLIENSINWEGQNELIIGNFGTPKCILRFREEKNIKIKLGIGSGASCSTRLATGVGYPMGSLIWDTKKLSKILISSNIKIIADGGIEKPADFCKAICLGANEVMVGRVLAGTKEACKNPIKINDKWYAPYKGMASLDVKGGNFVEGISGYVKYLDRSVKDVIKEYKEGLSSCLSYIGLKDINNVNPDEISFVSVTNTKENDTRLITF